MSTTKDEKHNDRRWLKLLIGLLAAFLAYILSCGPVLTVADRFNLGSTSVRRPLRAFYAPVFALAQASEFNTRLYEDYLGFWYRLILNKDYPRYSPGVPVEGLLTIISGISPGQSSFELFVPSTMSQQGSPISHDGAMALIIGKLQERGLYPAGFREQTGGRLYRFQRERDWEKPGK